MLESFETGRRVDKRAFEQRVPALRVGLINAQYDLRNAGFPVLVVIAGDDREGVNDLVQRLHEWMDARYLVTRAFGLRAGEELERPRAWRYWRELPPDGQVGLFIGGWSNEVIADRVLDRMSDDRYRTLLGHGRRLEQMLADDGALVLKFWLHLPEKVFRKRVKSSRKEGWIDARDERLKELYPQVLSAAEDLLAATNAPVPWTIVESEDERHRDLSVAEAILAAVTARLERAASPPPAPVPSKGASRYGSALASIDLSASLEKEEYGERLAALQAELRKQVARLRSERISTIVVFEGVDAAGKGGVIRRLTQPLDVRDYRIIPIGAPRNEELVHHYLWRFWMRLPRAGTLLVFDRSWYGRVLVERVEGLATDGEWRRAYDEINDFEAQLVEQGSVLRKFWLEIDREEQLARFRAREKTPYKKYKITDEDYRNRARWDDYAAAADEMVARTSTPAVPWTLVAANDKRHARIRVIEEVCAAMAAASNQG
jgi:polyphosphate:AMP phosphotransferase